MYGAALLVSNYNRGCIKPKIIPEGHDGLIFIL